MESLPQEPIFELEGSVEILTLSRLDKRNALTTQMFESLGMILEQVKSRDEIDVLVVTGNGLGLCASSDIETRLLPFTIWASPAVLGRKTLGSE